MPRNASKSKVTHDRFFLLGFGLFFIGIIGGAWWLFQAQGRQVHRLISEDTVALLEIQLNRENLSFIEDQLELSPNTNLSIPGVSGSFNQSVFAPWIGKNIALTYLPDQHYLHAFDYRNRSESMSFVESFLLNDETLAEIETEFGTIYTPSFSSNQAFLFYKGWLWWADSPETITTQLGHPNKLFANAAYQNVQRDLPRLKFMKLYLNFAGDTAGLAATNENQAVIPLLRGLGTSTPQWGLAFHIKDDLLQGDIKVITHQVVYDENQSVAKAANRTIPNLSYLAPKDALLFQNGEDLFAKYQHTKRYLAELDPQLSLVFEGLIRAQSETWFGPDFDFETEFLDLIRGQYAFILDFNQGLEIGFISTLGPDQDPNAINELIQKAQSRFTPTTELVKLPDGTTREELVAADPQNIPISEQTLNDVTYYTSNNENGGVNFSYAQIGNYLVMTNRVRLVEKIIQAHSNQALSLATNDDFRTSVMYEFTPAEVYGFVNAAKVDQLIFHWQETQNLETPFALNWMANMRNLTYTRQVFPEVMFIKVRAFFN